MIRRNPTTYSATLRNLRLNAFGIDQIVTYDAKIEIYQARANPELWRARPTFARGGHKWEATSAEALQALIAADFVECISDWRVNRYSGTREDRPSLRSQPAAS